MNNTYNFEKSRNSQRGTVDRSKTDNSRLRCYKCNSPNHLSWNCTANNTTPKQISNVNVQVKENEEKEAITAKIALKPELGVALERATVNIQGVCDVKCLIDSGTQILVVRKSILPENLLEPHGEVTLIPAFGKPQKASLVKLRLSLPTEHISGKSETEVLCAVIDDLIEEALIPPRILEELKGISGMKELNGSSTTNPYIDDNIEGKSELDINISDLYQTQEIVKGSSNEDSLQTESVDPLSKEQDCRQPITERKKFLNAQSKCDSLRKVWILGRERKENLVSIILLLLLPALYCIVLSVCPYLLWACGEVPSATTGVTPYTPNYEEPYIIDCDASGQAVGCVLAQLNHLGKEQPIAFASKKFTPTQTKWSTIEKEAFAIIFGLKRFEHYLFGTTVTVRSDHNPLSYITLNSTQSPRLQRWVLALQRFDLKIEYRKGKRHINADVISRMEMSCNS